MAFSTFTVFYNYHHSSSRTFSSLWEERKHVSINTVTLHFSLLQPLATTILLSISVSMNLPILDISYKWNHIICGLLCLASFMQEVFKVFICDVTCIRTSFLCMAESYSPLYRYTAFYLSISWCTVELYPHFDYCE